MVTVGESEGGCECGRESEGGCECGRENDEAVSVTERVSVVERVREIVPYKLYNTTKASAIK